MNQKEGKMTIFDFAVSKFEKMSTEDIKKGLLRAEGWGEKLHKNPQTYAAAQFVLEQRSSKTFWKKAGEQIRKILKGKESDK
jgi:hypothetical protein